MDISDVDRSLSNRRNPDSFLVRAGVRVSRFIIPVFILLACFLFHPALVQAQADPGDEDFNQKGPKWYVHGNIDLRRVVQWNDEDDDDDFYQYLSLSFGEATQRRITGYISARITQDLNGREHPDSFSSVADTHDRSYARLNAAYVDLRFDDLLDEARLGRQWLAEVPEFVRMDGIRLRTHPLERVLKTKLVLFGGIPEHYQESSRGGDRVIGGGFEIRPLAMTHISAFYTHLRDQYRENPQNNYRTVTFDDDLISVELRQLFLQRTVNFYGLYSNLNGNSRESRARLAFDSEDGRTSIGLNYRTLFSTQRSLSTTFDPYVSIFREYHPYNEASIDLRRELTDTIGVDAGGFIRRMQEDRDKGTFNREFERYYLGGHIKKWPVDESLITLAGDFYDSDGDKFWVAEGCYEHELFTYMTLKLGSGYSLYREDRFTFEEKSHVRSGFVRMDYDVLSNLKFIFEYKAERDDLDTTHTVETMVRFRF